MSEEEKLSHIEMIEEIITKKMKPLYWIIGIPMITMVTIFVTVALPIASNVIDNTKQIEKKADAEKVSENYLSKRAYHALQVDEHESDLNAIRNPENADLIYMRNNSEEAERLEIGSRGGDISPTKNKLK